MVAQAQLDALVALCKHSVQQALCRDAMAIYSGTPLQVEGTGLAELSVARGAKLYTFLDELDEDMEVDFDESSRNHIFAAQDADDEAEPPEPDDIEPEDTETAEEQVPSEPEAEAAAGGGGDDAAAEETEGLLDEGQGQGQGESRSKKKTSRKEAKATKKEALKARPPLLCV